MRLSDLNTKLGNRDSSSGVRLSDYTLGSVNMPRVYQNTIVCGLTDTNTKKLSTFDNVINDLTSLEITDIEWGDSYFSRDSFSGSLPYTLYFNQSSAGPKGREFHLATGTYRGNTLISGTTTIGDLAKPYKQSTQSGSNYIYSGSATINYDSTDWNNIINASGLSETYLKIVHGYLYTQYSGGVNFEKKISFYACRYTYNVSWVEIETEVIIPTIPVNHYGNIHHAKFNLTSHPYADCSNSLSINNSLGVSKWPFADCSLANSESCKEYYDCDVIYGYTNIDHPAVLEVAAADAVPAVYNYCLTNACKIGYKHVTAGNQCHSGRAGPWLGTTPTTNSIHDDCTGLTNGDCNSWANQTVAGTSANGGCISTTTHTLATYTTTYQPFVAATYSSVTQSTPWSGYQLAAGWTGCLQNGLPMTVTAMYNLGIIGIPYSGWRTDNSYQQYCENEMTAVQEPYAPNSCDHMSLQWDPCADPDGAVDYSNVITPYCATTHNSTTWVLAVDEIPYQAAQDGYYSYETIYAGINDYHYLSGTRSISGAGDSSLGYTSTDGYAGCFVSTDFAGDNGDNSWVGGKILSAALGQSVINYCAAYPSDCTPCQAYVNHNWLHGGTHTELVWNPPTAEVAAVPGVPAHYLQICDPAVYGTMCSGANVYACDSWIKHPQWKFGQNCTSCTGSTTQTIAGTASNGATLLTAEIAEIPIGTLLTAAYDTTTTTCNDVTISTCNGYEQVTWAKKTHGTDCEPCSYETTPGEWEWNGYDPYYPNWDADSSPGATAAIMDAHGLTSFSSPYIDAVDYVAPVAAYTSQEPIIINVSDNSTTNHNLMAAMTGAAACSCRVFKKCKYCLEPDNIIGNATTYYIPMSQCNIMQESNLLYDEGGGWGNGPQPASTDYLGNSHLSEFDQIDNWLETTNNVWWNNQDCATAGSADCPNMFTGSPYGPNNLRTLFNKQYIEIKTDIPNWHGIWFNNPNSWIPHNVVVSKPRIVTFGGFNSTDNNQEPIPAAYTSGYDACIRYTQVPDPYPEYTETSKSLATGFLGYTQINGWSNPSDPTATSFFANIEWWNSLNTSPLSTFQTHLDGFVFTGNLNSTDNGYRVVKAGSVSVTIAQDDNGTNLQASQGGYSGC
jgi:hypothetical protein